MAILKIKDHDEKKEREFEIDYLLSLTKKERFLMMFQKTKEMLKLAKRYENRKTTEIIKRT